MLENMILVPEYLYARVQHQILFLGHLCCKNPRFMLLFQHTTFITNATDATASNAARYSVLMEGDLAPIAVIAEMSVSWGSVYGIEISISR